MRALDLTKKYQADLKARNDAVRAEREAEAARAREAGASMPAAGDPDKETRLWNAAGHYAMIFIIWAAMLALVVGAALQVID